MRDGMTLVNHPTGGGNEGMTRIKSETGGFLSGIPKRFIPRFPTHRAEHHQEKKSEVQGGGKNNEALA